LEKKDANKGQQVHLFSYRGKEGEILIKNALILQPPGKYVPVCKLSPGNPFDFTDEQRRIFDRKAIWWRKLSLFVIKLSSLITNILMEIINKKRDNWSYLPPQQSIQDEEEEHPRNIGHEIFQRTDPVWYKQLGQLEYCPIAEGEKHRIDIGPLETGAKGTIK
jgi:hypothetical protein